MTNWSDYQRAIFDDVASGKGHTFVRARAGTGKTTTIVEALKHLPSGSRALLVAFNKSIAVELGKRAPAGVEVSTLHAFGLRALTGAFGRLRIDGNKVADELRVRYPEREDADFRRVVARAVSLAKSTLASTPEQIADVVEAFGLCDEARAVERVVQAAGELLDWCRTPGAAIDFDDMVWLPVVHGVKVRRYSHVFVDEAQDLNASQIGLIRLIRAERLICVGDDRQAIYGFRGADERAVENLVEEFSMRVLPLSITYRCAAAIVAEAQRLVPDYEAAPGAPAGVVRNTTLALMLARAGTVEGPCAGDFVLSRSNAPLVSACMSLLGAGHRSRIAGRDVGTTLRSLVGRIGGRTVEDFGERLDKWEEREVAALERRDRDPEPIRDKAACLRIFAAASSTIADFEERIEAMFSDLDDASAITLSSTHKAKGLERDRAFLLIGTYRPNKDRQEANLLYVAQTRARRELVYVTEVA